MDFEEEKEDPRQFGMNSGLKKSKKYIRILDAVIWPKKYFLAYKNFDRFADQPNHCSPKYYSVKSDTVTLGEDPLQFGMKKENYS
ncbi:hypothetical protein BpHYR1_027743 [Brachionus plicatilis]|uniref:Uncharacterized protein n=1 Tax=Brachionus plicatilis TaxID=10195 RepID=A0A3M7REP7_BRAPC|nr:hypothetical protein BpHYR1_027743 [Brachionus plicatilis]